MNKIRQDRTALQFLDWIGWDQTRIMSIVWCKTGPNIKFIYKKNRNFEKISKIFIVLNPESVNLLASIT